MLRKLYISIVFLSSLLIMISCDKETPTGLEDLKIEINNPVVSDGSVELSASLTGVEILPEFKAGFVYSANSDFKDSTITQCEIVKNSVSLTINNLTPEVAYFCYAYLLFEGVMYKSNSLSFKIPAKPEETVKITVYTLRIKNITNVSVSTGGVVEVIGEANILQRGLCWNTTGSPNTSGSKTSDGGGAGSFYSEITGLTPNTKYYVRAYATTSNEIFYGNEESFMTSKGSESEKQALLKIFENNGGSSWINRSGWNSNQPVGEWYGITVNDEGMVTKIKLPNNKVTGVIADVLSEFEYLEELDLSNNQVITLDLTKATSLVSLYCYSNKLKALDITNLTKSLDKLECGKQAYQEILKLSISPEQRTKWKNVWSKNPNNQNVKPEGSTETDSGNNEDLGDEDDDYNF